MVSHAIVSRPGGIHIKRDGRDPEGSKRKMIDTPTAVLNESDELRSQIGSSRQRMKLCPLQPKQVVSKSCRPSSLLHCMQTYLKRDHGFLRRNQMLTGYFNSWRRYSAKNKCSMCAGETKVPVSLGPSCASASTSTAVLLNATLAVQ